MKILKNIVALEKVFTGSRNSKYVKLKFLGNIIEIQY